MLYFNDIYFKNGAFGVILGGQVFVRRKFRQLFDTHNLRRLEMSDDRYHGMGNCDVPEGMPPVVDIVGRTGTMVIFDTDCFHHAATVSEGYECMIMCAHTGRSVNYTSVLI